MEISGTSTHACSTDNQVCAIEPAVPQCLDSLCASVVMTAEVSAQEPRPTQKVISAEMAKFHARIMHRQEKTMYPRSQMYSDSKVGSNNSNETVGQIKDALVYVCPRAEVG